MEMWTPRNLKLVTHSPCVMLICMEVCVTHSELSGFPGVEGQVVVSVPLNQVLDLLLVG